MRNHRGDGSSRMDQRKSKTDRLLNWMIAGVSLLILVVGCIILISVFNASSSNHSASQASRQTAASSSSESNAKESSSESSSGEVPNSGSTDSASSSASTASSASSAGTDQNHQASYDMGSPDWNAQVAAIAQATGVNADTMTILWLGNGGSPNSSLARISPKNAPSSIYVVHLVYQDGKWQADHVQKPGQ